MAINSFAIIESMWPKILSSKSHALIAVHKRNLIEYLNLIESTMSELELFPDSADPDIIQIRLTLSDIVTKIGRMVQ